jgi:L-2-hydroxycarboxylate dehydrogenase (NAD+)
LYINQVILGLLLYSRVHKEITLKITLDDLRHKVLEILSQNGLDEEQNLRIAEQVIWADMSGIKPMGVAKLTGTEPLQNVKPNHEVSIERETKLSMLINAEGNPSPLVSQMATDIVIEKAKQHGMAIIGVHNTYSSNLAQAYYVEKIAREDLIGVCMARSPASATGFDSIDPIFGTNPIGYGFPTKDEPVIFDMTTAAMTWSGLIIAKSNGHILPEHIAIDKDGNPTTDPETAIKGATLPFDGSHKGSGLAMVVEMLAGPLVGAAYCVTDPKQEWGSVFIAIDPNILIDVEEFKTNSSELVQRIKNSRKKKGISQIRLPGERAREKRKLAIETGFVEIEDNVAKELGWL